MKKLFLLILTVAMYSPLNAAEKELSRFDRFFTEGTMRINLQHCGDATSEEYFLEDIVRDPHWGGSKKYLIDTLVTDSSTCGSMTRPPIR